RHRAVSLGYCAISLGYSTRSLAALCLLCRAPSCSRCRPPGYSAAWLTVLLLGVQQLFQQGDGHAPDRALLDRAVGRRREHAGPRPPLDDLLRAAALLLVQLLLHGCHSPAALWLRCVATLLARGCTVSIERRPGCRRSMRHSRSVGEPAVEC